MHCHLGFAPDVAVLAREGAAAGIGALACTVAPGEFPALREALAPYPALHAALGLHPWQLADGAAGEDELALFCELAGQTPLIGEVGLDFGGTRAATRDAQVAALRRMLAACERFDANLYSVHAVRAAGVALDVLEEAGAFAPHTGNDVVFHWFSGTSAELTRARDLGCCFSVGPRMLATRRGRAYARDLPADRLLLETDEPARAGEALDGAAWRAHLEEALDALAAARGVEAAALAPALAATSERLLAR